MWLLVFSALGGAATFFTAALLIIRAVFRNADATNANTRAITTLNSTLTAMGDRINHLEIWRAVMEDRQRRR